MKKILITGAGSYIGKSLEEYLANWPEKYQVVSLDMVGDGWRERSFSGFDAVFHVAAIVHQSKSKDDPQQARLYDEVNHLLAVETAQKAKAEGVRQFLFMSSESVYGLTAAVGQELIITRDTPLRPVDNYGISKKKAEEELQSMADDHFRVAILRPPMIYGKGCKGNYQTLVSFARKLPLFPWVENRRSMLYIGNFTEFLRLLVDREDQGIFCPQDGDYVCTSRMVQLIAEANGRRLPMIRGVAWALKLTRPFTKAADKAFGSLCYDRALSDYPENYQKYTLEEAVYATQQK